MSREKLIALEHLQKIDLQIEALLKDAEAGPARVALLEGQVAKARMAADAERGKVADNERARRSIESQLEEEKDKVKKWEARLPQLKHPREFAALEREVNSSKKANEAAEEDLKRLQAEFEPLRAALQLRDAELKAKEIELTNENKTVAAVQSDLRPQIDALQAERERERTKVDPKLISSYENVRKRRGGKVVVPMTNSVCSGCNRKFAPQIVNRLLNGNIEICSSCLRIVFSPPPSPEASA